MAAVGSLREVKSLLRLKVIADSNLIAFYPEFRYAKTVSKKLIVTVSRPSATGTGANFQERTKQRSAPYEKMDDAGLPFLPLLTECPEWGIRFASRNNDPSNKYRDRVTA